MAGIKGLKKLQRAMSDLPTRIEKVVKDTLLEYTKKIFDEAMSKVPGSIASTYTLEVSENGLRIVIWTEEEMAAYLEFGTGGFAAELLSGKPQEMREDAMLFYVNGEGTMPAQPYLFPAFYKYRDEIVRVMDARIQKLVNAA